MTISNYKIQNAPGPNHFRYRTVDLYIASILEMTKMWYRNGWSFQDSIHYDLYLDKTELMCHSSDDDTKNVHCDKLHGVFPSRAGDPQLEGRGATGFGEGNGSACKYSGQAQIQQQGAVTGDTYWASELPYIYTGSEVG